MRGLSCHKYNGQIPRDFLEGMVGSGGKLLLVLRNLEIQSKIVIAYSWANFICHISHFIPQT